MLLIATLLTVFVNAKAATAQERRWIQVEALPNLTRANDRAAAFQQSLNQHGISGIWGFGLPSGWFGVVIGPYDGEEVGGVLASLKSERLIPSDSYITDGREFRDQFWPADGAAPPAEAVPAEVPPAEVTPAEEIFPEEVLSAPQPAPQPDQAAPEAEIVAEPADETPAEARASEAALDTDQRKSLQAALQWFGHYQGGIDGAFGPGTRNSMAAWQSAQGLEPTGILTTRQREALLSAHQGEVIAFGFAGVEEQESGIDVTLPLALVTFDRYEPPFVHYREKNGSGLSLVLISQPGDQGSLAGLYDVIGSFEAMPAGGTRALRDSEFTIEATDARVHSRAVARLSGGLIKGWMAFGKPENAARDARIYEVISASFRAVGDTALDPGLVPLDEAARRGLVAGIEVKKPIRGRSGFYVAADGAVLTTSEAVQSCGRITLDHATEAKLVFDEAGLALLRPVTPLAPAAVATFAASPRPGAGIVVAGYPYEGRLPAPVLTHGSYEEAGGLDGAPGLARLSVATQAGDAGGAVLDGSGAVIGMLLPAQAARAGAAQGQELPADVAFAADTARISTALQGAGITVAQSAAAPALAPETLNRTARGMTVLVSCWQ
ncbi:serine protease [Pseudogemmobacter hezensis]|uniref:serine protease n=1 Tax=Pseudogemmobacter hezensis TaxID=2737662 RepID=UPI0015553329|nr:serine protease [Pseudogemmobacter hezensis]